MRYFLVLAFVLSLSVLFRFSSAISDRPKKLGHFSYSDQGVTFYEGTMIQAILDPKASFCSSCRDCCCGWKDPWEKDCVDCEECWRDYTYDCKKRCPSEIVENVTDGVTKEISQNVSQNFTLSCPPVIQNVNCSCPPISISFPPISVPVTGISSTVNQECDFQLSNVSCVLGCEQGTLSCMVSCTTNCNEDPSTVILCLSTCFNDCSEAEKTCGQQCGANLSGGTLDRALKRMNEKL